MARCHFFGSRQTATQQRQTVSSVRSKIAVRLALVLSSSHSRLYIPSSRIPQIEHRPDNSPGRASGWHNLESVTRAHQNKISVSSIVSACMDS